MEDVLTMLDPESLSKGFLSGGEVLASYGSTVEGSADLGLIVVGDLLLEDLEALVDGGLNGLLRAGEDPNILGLGEEELVAGVYNGDVRVVGVEHAVVTGGGVGEELYLALSTVEGGNGVCGGDLVLCGVVLAVQHSDCAIRVQAVASLLAIVGLPRHAGVSSLLVPKTHVLGGIEVLLEDRSRAGTGREASIDNADEGKGSEDNSLKHDDF